VRPQTVVAEGSRATAPVTCRLDDGVSTTVVSRSELAAVLPDITVFDRYTYLVTELLWGTLAVDLVWYPEAFVVPAMVIGTHESLDRYLGDEEP